MLTARRGLVNLLRKVRTLEEMPQQAFLERAIAVNRHRNACPGTFFSVNVVTALDSKETPAVAFELFGEVLAGHESAQTAISMTRSFPVVLGGATSTDRQPSTAS